MNVSGPVSIVHVFPLESERPPEVKSDVSQIPTTRSAVAPVVSIADVVRVPVGAAVAAPVAAMTTGAATAYPLAMTNSTSGMPVAVESGDTYSISAESA